MPPGEEGVGVTGMSHVYNRPLSIRRALLRACDEGEAIVRHCTPAVLHDLGARAGRRAAYRYPTAHFPTLSPAGRQYLRPPLPNPLVLAGLAVYVSSV
jgi:hypothetical protein